MFGCFRGKSLTRISPLRAAVFIDPTGNVFKGRGEYIAELGSRIFPDRKTTLTPEIFCPSSANRAGDQGVLRSGLQDLDARRRDSYAVQGYRGSFGGP